MCEVGYFSSVTPRVYWFYFSVSQFFSSQTLKEISRMINISAFVEDTSECTAEYSHTELQNYFYDDGVSAAPGCALQLDENSWSQRLVESLRKSMYDYLKGWEISFCGTKTDLNELAELQQQISGVILNDDTLLFMVPPIYF